MSSLCVPNFHSAPSYGQPVTSSLSEVETDSQSDVVDRVVGSSPSSLSEESSSETDFIPEPARKHQNMG